MNNTTTYLISSTTSLCNKTSPPPYVTSRQFKIAEMVILSTMCLASLFGNLLIIWVVLRCKKLRTTSNLLIVNLAVCDMVCASTAIPFTLIVYNIITFPHYPYGPLGCKTIWPLSTYCNNGSVFTLVAIAIERYVNTSVKHRLKFTKKRVGYVIVAVHVLAFSAVVPYVVHLRYIVVGGVAYCYEAWDVEWAEFYTIALVLIQYAMPLLIMLTLYALAWRVVYRRNREAIKMSEDYESNMAWRASLYARASLAVSTLAPYLMKTDATESRSNTEAKTCLLKPGDLTKPPLIKVSDPVKRCSSIKLKDQKRFKKSGYKSEAGYIRHRQSVLTLKMFTLVVVVFAVFALPMQIAWMLGHVVSSLTFQIFVILTYVNPVVNCWIYGRYNKGIRHEYSRVLRMPCWSTADRKNSSMSEPVTTMTTTTMMARTTTTTTTTTSFYNPRGESMHVRRQEAFEQLFQAHIDESRSFQHLYRTEGVKQQTQEESE